MRAFGRGCRYVLLACLNWPGHLWAQDPAFAVDSGRIVSVDTAVYADAATAELIALARARHLGRALHLNGYRARIFTRLEGRVAASRFGRGFQMFGYETAARLTWQQPGDVRVDVLGARSEAVRLPGVRPESWATWWSEIFSDQLWFSPAVLGDEIQLMGLPDQDALHPLAHEAERFYRYAIVDSVTIGVPGRTVRAVAVRVEPTTVQPGRDLSRRGDPTTRPPIRETFSRDPTTGPRIRSWRDRARDDSPTLVSGEMWLDADSLDVVRMVVTFVGDRIWDDDDDAPVLQSVEADLEYGLHDGQHWLPLRQVLAATFTSKYLPGATLPATAVTTFSDYELTAAPPLVFSVDLEPGVTGERVGAWRCPDPWEWNDRPGSDNCADRPYLKTGVEQDGTRWEISVPPMDTLLDFDFETDFEHSIDLADNRIVERRLNQMAGYSEQWRDQVQEGRRVLVDWATALRAFGFNRVQGPSLGFEAVLDPRISFTSIHVGSRMGFADLRPTGFVTWQRDSPTGLFELGAYRSLQEREPWTNGVGLGNSLRALFLGHDEADYHLAFGAALRYRRRTGSLKDLSMMVGLERHRSVATVAESGLNDVFFGSGLFPANPPVAEGVYLRGSLVKEFFPGAGATRLALGVEGWASHDTRAARAWGLLDARFARPGVFGRFRAKAGRAFADPLPQAEFRAGGPETVRGYGYGVRTGRSFWSAQLDLEWAVSQWWSPVVFGDVGDTAYDSTPLAGVGVGVSALSGWMRLELAKGLNPSRSLRADLHFQIPLY